MSQAATDTARIEALLGEHPSYRYAAKDETDPTGARHFIRCNGSKCNARLTTATYGAQGETYRAHVAAVLVEAGVGFVAQAKAEAWDEGWTAGFGNYEDGIADNPYRAAREDGPIPVADEPQRFPWDDPISTPTTHDQTKETS